MGTKNTLECQELKVYSSIFLSSLTILYVLVNIQLFHYGFIII